jgi:hypothetical protein
MNLIAGLAVFVVVSQTYAERCTALVQVKQRPEELKEALVGKWVSDDADKIPVEFGADGSFRLALYKCGSADWKWQMAEGIYVVSDDGRVKYEAKLGGLAVKGQFTMKDGTLIHPTGANYQTRWKKLPKCSEPLPAKAASPEKWPGARSSLQALVPETATVVVAVARDKAEIHGRRAAHLSTQTTLGKGEVIEGGGYVFYAECRQKFQVLAILRGQDKPGDRVLEYSFVEKTEGFPLPPVQESFPADVQLILLIGEKGNVLKALPDTQENRKAVRTALSEQKGKKVPAPEEKR